MTTSDSTFEKWDVFLSYASEDRADVAEPLVTSLSEWGLRVWFDQTQLRLGDSLRRSLDNGLSRCRFGVVVLSEAFFGKHWPNVELDGLANREVDGNKVVLPVWVRLSDEQVRSYSPPLADRVAVKWEEGVDCVSSEIVRVVRPDLFKKGFDGVLPLARIRKADQLIFVLRGAEAWNFGNEQPANEEELSFVADFLRFLQWWVDVNEDCDADQGARMRFLLIKKANDTQERGWRIFAAPDTRKSAEGKSLRVATVALVREGANAVVSAGGAFLIQRNTQNDDREKGPNKAAGHYGA